jgi:hypothetical protein
VRGVKGPQTKYFVPLKMRITPMKIMEAAAIRSPKNRAFRERRDAERPVKNSAGTVPSPKEVVIRNPVKGFAVEAALTIRAQDNRQGRNPVARPRANFEDRPRERKRGGKMRPQKEQGAREGIDKTGKGRIFRRIKPRRIIRAPAPRVKPPRRPPRT